MGAIFLPRAISIQASPKHGLADLSGFVSLQDEVHIVNGSKEGLDSSYSDLSVSILFHSTSVSPNTIY